MSKKTISESGFSALRDEQDVKSTKSKILKSSNPKNPDSDKNGWELKKLGDIGKISMCKRILKEQTLPNGDIPFYKIGTFGKTPNAFISKEIYDEFVEKYPFPKKGDILISASGTIGRCVIYDGEPAYFQDSNIVWIANDEKKVLNSFLYKFYSYCDWNPSKGATISRLYNNDLRKIPIPVPPLAEQQRIVAYLDQTFAALNQAKANTLQNLQNAKELFETELRNVFENKGEGWEEKTLSQISKTFGRGKSKHRPRNWEGLYGGNYPFIQTGDIRNCDHYITEYSQTYNEVGLSQSKLWKKGTICITIAANIAETGILSFDACFPDSIIGIEVNEKFADRDFVEYLLQFFKVRIQALGKGAAQANINMGTFEHELFPFPKVTEQQEIVAKLDTLKTQTQQLESIYQTKLNNIEELYSGILKRTFENNV
jgi:type I restriction enzyme, S subunit